MKQRRAFCPHPAIAWYERPPELVRVGAYGGGVGRVVDVVPRKMVKLCKLHHRKGDKLVDQVDGGRCGFGFNAPPRGGVFIETAARPRRDRR